MSCKLLEVALDFSTVPEKDARIMKKRFEKFKQTRLC